MKSSRYWRGLPDPRPRSIRTTTVLVRKRAGDRHRPSSRSSVVSRDRPDDIGALRLGHFAREIAEAEDTDHALVLVDDGKTAYFLGLHRAKRLRHIVVRAAIDDALRHDIAGAQRAAGFAVRKPAADDVAVGYHADEAIILAHRDGADILALHLLRHLGNRSFRRHPRDAFVHDLFNFHRNLHECALASSWHQSGPFMIERNVQACCQISRMAAGSA